MLVELYCKCCVNILNLEGGTTENITKAAVEVELADLVEAPMPEDLHSRMSSELRDHIRHLSIIHVEDPEHTEATVSVLSFHKDDWGPMCDHVLDDAEWAFSFSDIYESLPDAQHQEGFLAWSAEYTNPKRETPRETKRRWDDALGGIWASRSDWAQNHFDSFDIPDGVDTSEWPYNTIDWEMAGEDKETDGAVSFIELENGDLLAYDPTI